MADEQVDVDGLRAQVVSAKAKVKTMKKEKADPEELKKAIANMQALTADLQRALKTVKSDLDHCERPLLDDLLKRRMFVVPAFEIYGGVAGLYDFGPPACAVKANFLAAWRQHFIMAENMLEIECTNLTPHAVLKTSGHVDKFSDFMVKDAVTGECLRADHLLEGHLEKLLEDITITAERRLALEHIYAQADAYSCEELGKILNDFGIKGPTGNDLTPPFPFNLMFGTQIGPEGHNQGYLRPETAQGIFVNFKRLLDYNGGKMPFAGAQIGIGFRNEISPRAGLLRVREFPMAEIEHFVDPDAKDHPRFKNIADMELPLFPRASQLGDGKVVIIKMGEAVSTEMVNNQTLGYFIARTYLFLVSVGIKATHIRFRQHLETEMAHYACDCWDCEICLTYGWTECVGIADRSCFDLTQHGKARSVDMRASSTFAQPVAVEVAVPKFDKKILGKTFKRDQKKVIKGIEELSVEDAMAVEALLAAGETFTLKTCEGEFAVTREMVSFTQKTKMVKEKKFTPSVIEPSFGVGRILYAIFEHAYYTRGDASKIAKGKIVPGVMKFRPTVAPLKCSIFPLSSGDEGLDAVVHTLAKELMEIGVSNKVDTSGASIGKRYARTDEVGIPFAITIDFETIKADSELFQTVTVRERDSTKQVRVPVQKVAQLIKQLAEERVTFEGVLAAGDFKAV